jgi:IS5 family transposase
MEIEQLPLRQTVIRIEDSILLRQFVGIPTGRIMDYSTLSKVHKAIRHQTWKKINAVLGSYAKGRGWIDGEQLRVDTTAYETTIAYPTDSAMLAKGYEVIARELRRLRDADPEIVERARFQEKRVRRYALRIGREAVRKEKGKKRREKAYRRLFRHAEEILKETQAARRRYQDRVTCGVYVLEETQRFDRIWKQLDLMEERLSHVLDQARRRVLEGEQVPNSEKILSLFEPHTELLKRGKAHKPIEFGHMVLVGEVENHFISDYDVFEKRPNEATLVDDILNRHQEAFGRLPRRFVADAGFHESSEKTHELKLRIPELLITRKGRRPAHAPRTSPLDKLLHAFRAGIEGMISFLKRRFGLDRCPYRSFATYTSSVGALIFAHNLIVLTRL